MKHFLYVRGQPGVGKITVAKLIEKETGWKTFWFHDLKNAVYNIVKEHRIPRLMDELTVPVIRFLLDRGDNVIYVRPSPDKETVENIRKAVESYPDYEFHVIRLEAAYDTLLERVSGRDDPFRISGKKDLDEYVRSREVADVEGESIIKTDGLPPKEVAQQVMSAIIGNK